MYDVHYLEPPLPLIQSVFMVAGMSVKSGEPQGGNTSSANRKIPTQTKTKVRSTQRVIVLRPLYPVQAPVEALQMARILDDSRYPADLSDKIRSVLAIVPHRSEEEICIALHDTDFDPEKAISVLLDNDNHSSTGVSGCVCVEHLGEWVCVCVCGAQG